MFRPLLFCLFPAFLAPLARPASAQTPVPGSRIIKDFDFEETRLGNFESTPMFWSKVTGRGFPAYSAGAFDHAVFHASDTGGNTSFKLTTQGGSVAYRFSPPPMSRIPVEPNSDYYIIAFVRTEKLDHARGDLAAWFTDDKANLILSSEEHSQAYRPSDHSAHGTSGQAADPNAWQVLYIHMSTPDATPVSAPSSPATQASSAPAPAAPAAPADPTATAGEPKFLTLQVGLLQPQQQDPAGNPLGRFALYQQDIQGSVWFDDIVIFQLPRIKVKVVKQANSPAPAGMFAGGEQVSLDLLVSDLRTPPGISPATPAAANTPTSPLRAQLQLQDADGRAVDTADFSAAAAPGHAWSHRYTHAPLAAGLYTATVDVFDPAVTAASNALVARRQSQFLCLPPADSSSAAPAPDYALDATVWNQSSDWPNLPALCAQTGAGLVQIPVWRREMPASALTLRDAPLEALFAALDRRNIRALGAFSELPGPIAGILNSESRGSLLALINADPKTWQPAFSFPLTRYVNHIDAWQLGSPNEPFSGALPGGAAAADPASAAAPAARGPAPSEERYAQLFGRIYPAVSSLLPQSEMMIPWNALFDFPADRFPHASLNLEIPPAIKPAQIPAYLANFHTPAGRLFIRLDALPQDQTPHGPPRRFRRALVYARTVNPPPDAVLFPVRPGQADELLLVYRTMIRALAQGSAAGEITPAAEVHAFIFKKPADATMVIWNGAAGSASDLDLPLGRQPQTTDLLGNPEPLSTDPATQLTHIHVTGVPRVIQHVDPRPLQLSASFALANTRFPSGAGSVSDEILLSNPYPEPLTGTLRLTLPPRWSADPNTFSVSIAPGENLRLPVNIAYPFSETAGLKHIAAKFRLEAGNPTGLSEVDFSAAVTVGSDLIDMEAFYFLQDDGDILLQQVITNISGDSINAQAYALIPGFPGSSATSSASPRIKPPSSVTHFPPPISVPQMRPPETPP